MASPSLATGNEIRVTRTDRGFLRSLLNDPGAVFGIIVLVAVIGLALTAGLIAPFDPSAQDIMVRRMGPDRTHLLGTDNLGRDILSRLFYGGRSTLFGSTLAVALSLAIGVPLGLVAGYYGRLVDSTIMRAVDVLLSFPSFLLAIVIVAILGASLQNAAIAIGIAGIPPFARLVRGQVLSLRQREFVLGAIASGASSIRIMFRYILPNLLYSILTFATLALANSVLAIAGLSFLGLGAQPPTPEWGLMVRDGTDYLEDAPHIALWPGASIVLLILAFNMIGDAVQSRLNPRGDT